MTLSFRARQAATVTVLVLGAMLTLGSINLASLVRLSLEESRERGELLAHALFHRARVVVQGAPDACAALREDPGIRAILESSIAYTESVTYAAIITTDGIAIAHSSPLREGQPQPEGLSLNDLLGRGAIGQVASVYRDTTLEVAEPMLLGDAPFGSIRIGLSPVLVRRELQQALRPAITALLVTLTLGLVASLMLARWALRPIHMIRAGLTQLGQGETAAHLELPPGKDFSGLNESFEAISARLSDRATADAATPMESLIERVEDAVAVLDRDGAILFANTAMRATLPQRAPAGFLVSDALPEHHPYRRLVREAIDHRRSSGPLTVAADEVSADAPTHAEYVVACHTYANTEGTFSGVVLTARDVGYLSSVQSTMESSRQIASLGQLLAGVAHEVKNPLNAMTIHLELIRHKILQAFDESDAATAALGSLLGLRSVDDADARGSDTTLTVATPPARGNPKPQQLLQHVTTISNEVKRLDEVIQGFLHFVRPDDAQHELVVLPELVTEVFDLVRPDAERMGVRLEHSAQDRLPSVMGNRSTLRQALLNLALNACQAMPRGGALRVHASAKPGWVVLDVWDTGTGISPDDLERIFELYYTTRPGGSGIGLSMVYRIIKLHGGEIEVESTVGGGTRFRLMLPHAQVIASARRDNG